MSVATTPGHTGALLIVTTGTHSPTPAATTAPNAARPGTALASSAATPHASPTTSATPSTVPSTTPTQLVTSTATPASVPNTTNADSGLGDFTWGNLATLLAALLAAGGVILTLLVNAARSRRDNLATLYADALGAVAEYLEGPYRILRKDSENSTRFAITSKLSDVKTAIDHNQALLRLHAREGVADAYDAYVEAAKKEAGRQMHDAWEALPVLTDSEVNLPAPLPRDVSEAARRRLLEVMQADLGRRWYLRASWIRYEKAVQAVETAKVASPSLSKSSSGNPAGDPYAEPEPQPDGTER